MILVYLILILFVGGLLCWLADRARLADARWLALIVLVAALLLLLTGYFNSDDVAMAGRQWLAALHVPWINRVGVSLILAMDGLSFLMVLLTLFLGIVAVLSSWQETERSSGFFHFNLLWILAGVVGMCIGQPGVHRYGG